MRKPDLLRAAVQAALPELARDPHMLKIWLDKGRLVAIARPGSPSRPAAMEYRYELSLFIVDFAGDPNVLFGALMKWLEVEQPELLLRPLDKDAGLPFEIDILDDRRVDILVRLDLNEAVQADADGVFSHLAEPGIVDDDTLLSALANGEAQHTVA